MNREEAIEAGARAIFGRLVMPLPNTWPGGAEGYERDRCRAEAAAVIDAAAPHLTPEPVGYVVVDENAIRTNITRWLADAQELRYPGERVVALIPVDEP